MCMPHGGAGKTDSGYIEIKPKKHIKKMPKDIFEKGDPKFVDERTKPYIKPQEKKSFLDYFFED